MGNSGRTSCATRPARTGHSGSTRRWRSCWSQAAAVQGTSTPDKGDGAWEGAEHSPGRKFFPVTQSHGSTAGVAHEKATRLSGVPRVLPLLFRLVVVPRIIRES